MRTLALFLIAAVSLSACGADDLANSDLTSVSAELAGTPGPNPTASVSDIIHSEAYAFACEPSVLHVDNLVSRVSLHSSIRRSLVDASTVVIFGNTDEPIDPILVTSDAIGNMIVRVAADQLVNVVAVPQTELVLEGAHLDGTVFSAQGVLMVMD